MANQHREKLRGVRGVDDQLWSDFGDAVAPADRSAELRRYMEWFVGRLGAEPPQRPEPPRTEG